MPTPRSFSHVLVPYDGSEPARAALTLAIALARRGAALAIVTIVDETPVMAQSATTLVAFDPTPLMDALDSEGHALLDDAKAQCQAANVTPVVEIVHDRPVAGIIAAITAHACDLVIMGTHARTGVARTFLGSTTEGVLRMSSIPVLTVRSAGRIQPAPFGTALVAVDDSEPADAALAVGTMLASTAGTHIVACHVLETAHLYNNAIAYGFDPGPLAEEMRSESSAILKRALARAALAPDTPVAMVDGDAVEAVLAAADERHVDVIVVGTHGRRGLRRLILGSVAEHIVRSSPIPVLVVPQSAGLRDELSAPQVGVQVEM
jgi:nucleotide-binding universal stress UspA family protein